MKLLTPVPDIPLASLIIEQYYKLGNDPLTNKTLDFLRLRHAPSFVSQFVIDRFLRQGDLFDQTLLGQTQEDIDAKLTALKVSQENRHQAVAEAASSFPYLGLSSKRQVAWTPPVEERWTSTEEPWPSPGDTWPSTESAWPSIESAWHTTESAWPSFDVASSSSHRSLLPNDEDGKVYNHYNDFFAARKARQKELMKVEKPRDRQAHESRERMPGVKNAKVYEWLKTQSSGGREAYKRVKVNKKRNEDVYDFYKPCQRLFNAFANEWDLCEEFTFGNKKDEHDSDDDSDDDSDHYYPKNFVSQPTSVPQLATAPMDIVEHEDNSTAPMHSRDPLKTLSLVYGYVPRSSPDGARLTLSWDAILSFLGFVGDFKELDVPESERNAMISFFCTLVSTEGGKGMSSNLEHLFPFQQVQRPSEDLFVFSSPPSNACRWVLGVHSPAAALYVCRYMLENPDALTILTVAHHLLDQGIRFRTLLTLPCSPRQLTVSEPYVPKTHRLINHTFTATDFDVAMLACQSVLTSPQGRAALLRGGIIGRIAKEFLSIDGALDGPSVEVTAHRVGYISPSGNDDTRFCDDHLTDNEIAIICGTYSLYTGEFYLLC